MTDFESKLTWALEQLAQRRNASPVTIKHYRWNLRRLDRELDGLLDSPQVMVQKLTRWRDEQQARLRLPRTDKNSITASKIATDVAALRTFYRELVAKGRYPSNPADEINSIKLPKMLPRPMPYDQLSKLCESIDLVEANGLRDRAIIELLYHGLRRTEVCRLDTEHLQVSVEDETMYVSITGKGNKQRLNALHPASALLVAKYILHQFAPEWTTWDDVADESTPAQRLLQAAKHTLDNLPAPSTPLFFQMHGNRFTEHSLNKMFRRRLKAAEIAGKWGPHSLRHSFGTEMIGGGEDVRIVQELLGHNDIRTTMGYTQVLPGAKLASARRLRTPAAEVVA